MQVGKDNERIGVGVKREEGKKEWCWKKKMMKEWGWREKGREESRK